jgi:UDP-N-acetylglucosamine:LPS N-acetylglucosamine transferase
MTSSAIVVVSGSYGAGHDAAAQALTDQLRSAGHRVSRFDLVDELSWRVGRLLRWLYFAQLRLLPATWGTTLRFLEGDGLLVRAVCQVLALLGRPLVRRLQGADLVISTHPFASQALGAARAAGRLEAPVVTYLTDASVHRLWVHDHVDLHLAIHAIAAAQAEALGGRSVVVEPAVALPAPLRASDWVPPWPAGKPAALVVGGSCGVGELRASAMDVLATGLMTPVVVCGTNERLREQVEGVPGLVALGWRDDMPSLLAGAACVIQNAGGMTSLESLAAGTPTLTYRPIPGHGHTNARALDDAGLVPWVPDAAGLEVALMRILVSGSSVSLPREAPSVVEVMQQRALLLPQPALVAA